MSFFGRLNYDYKEKYLLEINAVPMVPPDFLPKSVGIFLLLLGMSPQRIVYARDFLDERP